jgi:hypothetical protein
MSSDPVLILSMTKAMKTAERITKQVLITRTFSRNLPFAESVAALVEIYVERVNIFCARVA